MMFKTVKTDKNVLSVYVDFRDNYKEQWVLLQSDEHHDNIKADNELELKHLKQAKERNAMVIKLGDNFCCMQGKFDLKRSDKADLKPEHKCSNYLDRVVEDNADFLDPFAHNIIAINPGNHETSILKKHETDLTQRLVSILNYKNKSNIHCLGYTSWFIFRFTAHSRGKKASRVLWSTHGYGGGLGITHANKEQLYIEGADIIASGHLHKSYTMEYIKHRVNNKGMIDTRRLTYVRLPTYKDAYGKGLGGFEVEKGMGPRPKGAYWLRFFYTRNGVVDYEVIKAN